MRIGVWLPAHQSNAKERYHAVAWRSGIPVKGRSLYEWIVPEEQFHAFGQYARREGGRVPSLIFPRAWRPSWLALTGPKAAPTTNDALPQGHTQTTGRCVAHAERWLRRNSLGSLEGKLSSLGLRIHAARTAQTHFFIDPLGAEGLDCIIPAVTKPFSTFRFRTFELVAHCSERCFFWFLFFFFFFGHCSHTRDLGCG